MSDTAARARILDELHAAGTKLGRWTLIAKERCGRKTRWTCKCDCGSQKSVRADVLLIGHSRSCGCLAREELGARTATHGLSKSRTFKTWSSMMERCDNPRLRGYRYYGGRGIGVCTRWRNSFVAFLADMGERPPGMTLDRIDNYSGYEPGNCRWATAATQTRNQRGRRLDEVKAAQIREAVKQGNIYRVVAAQFGVTVWIVGHIARGKTWLPERTS